MTAGELLMMPDDHLRHELVEGVMTTFPLATGGEGRTAANLSGRVGEFVEARESGALFAGGTGFWLARDPDTVLAPDLAFVARERMGEVTMGGGFGRGAPDLVVEITSPEDTYEEVDLKVRDWIRAGARLVWVVNPRTRTVAVHAPGADVAMLEVGATLEGRDVLPGFACRVGALFG